MKSPLSVSRWRGLFVFGGEKYEINYCDGK